MIDIFFKYHTARSLYRQLKNMLLLCTKDSNYEYCYCYKLQICSLCRLCEFFNDEKIDNHSVDEFLKLNCKQLDELKRLVYLISPLINRIELEKKNTLCFFSREYYYYFRDIATGKVTFMSLDDIING